MAKQYSVKFWIIFWTISAIFLTGWTIFLQTRNNGVVSTVNKALSFLPLDPNEKEEYKSALELADGIFTNDGQTKTYLLLFQNNMEIRPGGGFIGAFGIVKIKDMKVVSIETHDLSNFDARIPDSIEPPYPMRETLAIKSWKLRDSNFFPDFETNAKKAMEFYYMGQGQEKFDGVIGITTNVLASMLKVTGPIQMENYPGIYDSENAVISLEYQVEKDFENQGIERGERKSIMGDLAREIEKRISIFSISEKMQLAKILLEDLNKKDIQLYFTDEKMQSIASASQWSGDVDENWQKDYLMMIDANLGAFKSDYYVKRNAKYMIDFSGEVPVAKLAVTYKHNAKQKDWMTRDYLTFLRVYVPEGSWLTDNKNFSSAKFGNEFGKKYFGSIVKVPIGGEKTVELTYTLPKEITNDYQLKIQKQAGINDMPVEVFIKYKDGKTKNFSQEIKQDIIVDENTIK